MAIQTKPTDINKVWAAAGAKITPSDSKIAQGWITEIPTHQGMNWLQNQFAAFCKHVNQAGIAVWDAVTSYDTNSIAKGSNGLIYVSKTDDNVNNDPTTDDGTNWLASNITPAVGFTAQLTAPVALNHNTNTPIIFNQAFDNTGGYYNTTTGQFTAPFNGVYDFDIGGQIETIASDTSLVMEVLAGASVIMAADNTTHADAPSPSAESTASRKLKLTAGQIVHFRARQLNATSVNLNLSNGVKTYISCALLYRT